MRFEWDAGKAASNLRKHGLSFEEASELFTSGVDYLEEEDVRFEEPRYRAIGPISSGVVKVVFVERAQGNVMRIISARLATRREVQRYQAAMEEL